MKKPSLGQLGEFRLLKRLEKTIYRGDKNEKRILVDIGDDAFAVSFSKSKILVATNDVLVENVHFRRNWIQPQELGYKALTVNLSDLAAMGGASPLYAFVGLAMPGDISVDFVDKLYTGMNKVCKEYGFIIAGGDTVSSNKDIVISITLLGEIERKRLISRSGAKPGDLVFVTGTFGDSAAGLNILEKKGRASGLMEENLINKHILPIARMKTAELLAKTGYVTSMIDSSDGLAASLNFISDRSGVGIDADVQKIPISAELWKYSLINPKINPIDLALNGGEDYELVFTAKPSLLRKIKNISKDITCIGTVNNSKRVKYYSCGNPVKINAGGYQAFVR